MERINYLKKTITKAFKSADLIVSKGVSIREAGKRLGYSKSAVAFYIHNPVKDLNPVLYSEVVKVLQINRKEATIRGGQSTHLKYKRLREDFNFEGR